MRMLDLFCGRFGWSRAFAARGWECVGVDLVEPPEIPEGCRFFKADVLTMHISFPIKCVRFGAYENLVWPTGYMPDFICASPPCEQFSVHGMKHFHPNPPYPELGIKLFNHTRQICEASGVPYVIENVRAAQQFVEQAVHHCGPFYLWGNGVPPLLNGGIIKGNRFRGAPGAYMERRPATVSVKEWRNRYQQEAERLAGGRPNCASVAATIPPELASCVCDYAERLCEQKAGV